MNGWTQADIDAYERRKAAGKSVLTPVGKAIAKAFEDAHAGKARGIAYAVEHPPVPPPPFTYGRNLVKPVMDCSMEPIKEHRFHAKRKWRFDYAWPSKMIALEVEGGAWSGGRHTRGAGFIADMEKYNEAGLIGWRVFRCVPGDEAGWIERINGMEGGNVR